jgi:UDP-glucose 4-epimerase
MPFIAQTAVGKRDHLSVFGDDYDTHDGTGVRDYIHVMDLADGHVKALDRIKDFTEVMTINLGTGTGYSVLDMVKAFEKASGQEVPYRIAPRRAGDIATCYADPSYAKKILDWEAKRNIKEMCEDSWRWQSANPNGYNHS